MTIDMKSIDRQMQISEVQKSNKLQSAERTSCWIASHNKDHLASRQLLSFMLIQTPDVNIDRLSKYLEKIAPTKLK